MQLQNDRQNRANSLYMANPTQEMEIDKRLVYGIQDKNTDQTNERNLAQTAADYEADQTDSFMQSIMKGLIFQGTVGAAQAGNSAVSQGVGSY